MAMLPPLFRFNHFLLLGFLSVLLASCSAPETVVTTPTERPNILLFIADISSLVSPIHFTLLLLPFSTLTHLR